jgi:hypothetical protein
MTQSAGFVIESNCCENATALGLAMLQHGGPAKGRFSALLT